MLEVKHLAADGQTRAALHEVLSLFESYKATNDQRLLAIEQKKADGLLEHKLEQIEQALQSAQTRLEGLNRAQLRPELKGGLMPEPQLDSRVTAFEAYMREGALGLELKAGLSSSSGSGTLAPAQTERFIMSRLQSLSPFRSLATVRTIGAQSFKKPVSTSAAACGWVSETQARPETDPSSLAVLNFTSGELYAQPSATQDLLKDAQINLDEWLASEIEDAFAAQENTAFVSGDGVNKPMGFLSTPVVADQTQGWGQLGYVPSGASGAFALSSPQDALIDLIYALKSQFRAKARFVMNRRTAAKIRKFKDAEGNYIWQPALMASGLPLLMGYPVQELEDMPDVSVNSLAIGFGDFAKGYLIVDRAGISILRDPYSAKPYVLFYTTKRVGGGVQNFDAIKLMKFAVS